jgi:hypothetical protein
MRSSNRIDLSTTDNSLHDELRRLTMGRNADSEGSSFDPIDPVIPPTVETEAATRPPNVGKTHKESESDAASEEQLHLHEAAGESAAEPSDVEAAATKRARDSADLQTTQAEQSHAVTQEHYIKASQFLGPWVNRPDHAKLIYWARLMFLLLGDLAGISGAALLLGETYFNAFGQALSAAVAAVTLGAVGTETKRLVQSRARAVDYDESDGGFAPYRALFRGRNDADRLVHVVTLVAALGTVCIVIAIFALRAATEGASAAWCFALIAASVGLASFINSYGTTCDIGEFLDRLRSDLVESKDWLATCISNPIIARHDGAVKRSELTRAIWAARGQAAWWARQREKFAILNANPRTVGNGEAASPKQGDSRGTVIDDDSGEAAA